MQPRYGPLTFKGWTYLIILIACGAFWYFTLRQIGAWLSF